MRNWAATGVLFVLVCQYAGVVRADSDSSDSSSSGESKHKNKYKATEHKYNNAAYPGMFGYSPPMYPYYPYPYPPPYAQYPPQQMGGYPQMPYNPYMQLPPPPPPPQQPPYMYPNTANQGAYPPQSGAGQNPGYNPNSLSNQPQQPQQPSQGTGSSPNYPPGGSSVINHSLKVNKEYNEDGHHSTST